MHHLCQCISSIVDCSTAQDLVGRDVLHENNKVTEFHIYIKLVRSIKICVIDSCNKIFVVQHLSNTFPIQKNSRNMVFKCVLRYTNYKGPRTPPVILGNKVSVPHARVKAIQRPRRMKTCLPVSFRWFSKKITQPSYRHPARQCCLSANQEHISAASSSSNRAGGLLAICQRAWQCPS
jgi:hypothetical protein